jgi:ABC-2 type transport system ATP-binding protein
MPAAAEHSAASARRGEVVIAVEGLTKRYGDVVAADRVTLEVHAGECVGILGPNGAGKTTTLELIEGLREPDAGSVRVLGSSPWPRNPALLRRIGVQLQASAFIEKLTAAEQLTTIAALYDVPVERATDALALVELEDKAGDDVEELSGGQRQRLAIACALVHEPELVFLDEPSAALDPASRRRLWSVIRRIGDEGTTVVLTTHHMDEAEELCDRVAIIDRGRILTMDSPAELVRQLDAPTRLLLRPDAIAPERVSALTGVLEVRRGAGALEVVTRRPATVLGELAALDALHGLQVRSGTLEDVFISLTGRELVDPEDGSA